MNDAIKRLHDYLAKSPSVVYPEDVLAYLPAIEDENARLREYVEAAAIHSYEGGVWCDKCTFRSQCYGDEPKEHQGRGCQWVLWAHELGVDVP